MHRFLLVSTLLLALLAAGSRAECQKPSYYDTTDLDVCKKECGHLFKTWFTEGSCEKITDGDESDAKCSHVCAMDFPWWTKVCVILVVVAAILIILFFCPLCITSCIACFASAKSAKKSKQQYHPNHGDMATVDVVAAQQAAPPSKSATLPYSSQYAYWPYYNRY